VNAVRFVLRPATPDDADFAWHLFKLTMQESIEAVWGEWDEIHWDRFFRDHFDPMQTQVVVVAGQDVGILRVEERRGEVWLDTVEIAPEHQGRGLGSAIVHAVLEEARSRDRPVGLQVNRANRARQLYERLGFVEVDTTETHYLIRAERSSR
jgi:GNAT superfamily N-acetyltransferase